MNIGFIEDTPLRGGTQIWVTEATQFFLNKGENVIILAPEGSWTAKICNEAGAEVHTYDYDKVISEDDENKKIWTETLSLCDVAVCTVHPPRQSFHCSVFAGTCIKDAGLETILIPKSGTIVPNYLRKYYVPYENIPLKVIAITEFTRNYMLETYKIPAETTELIYQGTEVELFTSDVKRKKEAFKRYILPENAFPVIGCIGTYEERKGQTVLLESLKIIVNGDLPDAHLVLVGEGPDEIMLKEKVKELGLSDNVSFFEFTREPVYIYERIDILVLSSLYKEGLPNVLLEAMSMNTPVVSSRMAGVPEVVKNGETGFMVEPGNKDELAKAILNLCSDVEKMKQMGDNGRLQMVEKFDKKVQFEAFLQYFHKISGK
ncbi:glycosyltransferase family 4 protein [Bacteroidota bacterium]